MRKIALLLSLVALSQLTGCVAHRYYADAPTRSYNGYNQPYPTQYQDQTQYQNRYQSQYSDRYVELQTPQYQQPRDAYRPDDQYYRQQAQTDVAQIIAIRNIREVSGSNGGGAVVGAILGGIIGNQLARDDGHGSSHGRGYYRGHDRGRDNDGARGAATVGGAIVGGVIGNEIDRSSNGQRDRTEITLRFASGQTQGVMLDGPARFRVGDQVRVRYQDGRWVIY